LFRSNDLPCGTALANEYLKLYKSTINALDTSLSSVVHGKNSFVRNREEYLGISNKFNNLISYKICPLTEHVTANGKHDKFQHYTAHFVDYLDIDLQKLYCFILDVFNEHEQMVDAAKVSKYSPLRSF
jgi:hypothetical protein